jgi:hypothetical protein
VESEEWGERSSWENSGKAYRKTNPKRIIFTAILFINSDLVLIFTEGESTTFFLSEQVDEQTYQLKN